MRLNKTGARWAKRRIILLVFGMLVFLIGGTMAVVRDLSFFNNLFQLKEPFSSQFIEDFTPPHGWKTCDTEEKQVFIKNTSEMSVVARLSYDEWWKASDGETDLPLERNGNRLAIINFQNEDDWLQNEDGWYYYKTELAPGETTSSYFASVTYNCDENMSRDVICEETANGVVCENPEDPYAEADYHLKVTTQTIEPDGVSNEFHTLTVNPNGGKFNNSTETYTASLRHGTIVDISNITNDDSELEFAGWTKQDSSAHTGNTVTVNEDTTLTANWRSSAQYTVTVDPNGGTYNNSDQITSYLVREGGDYEILDAERNNYALEGWEYLDGTPVSSNTITNITDNISIRAIWAPAVARIERTGKLYSSIMRAEAEAIADDVITLLVDTAETVTNEKTVTLDLNEHTVTGSLTNTSAGNLTLINGEINNPDGIAVTNDGTFTMGINDYKSDGKVNIINDYVRLIGTTTGIKQDGVFNYYDGFIEGDVGLEGGYDDAPAYRNTFDGTVVHYFPLVDHNWVKDCQHVELANADLAVSKTTVKGDIYYYNLQDNINTSARTGYQIYIIRNFDASYPLTSPADTNVNIDLVGYNVATGDNIVINGTLNISDSGQTIGEGSEAVTTKGIMTVRESITVNNGGTLNVDGAEIQEITSNTLLHNQGTVNLTNSAKLSSINGNVMVMTNDEILPNMDAASMITSSSTSSATILNRRRSDNPLVINGGVIHSSARYAIESDITDTRINLNGGEIRITGNAKYAVYESNTSSPVALLTIDGGKINMDQISNGATATYRTRVELKSGGVFANGSGTITGFYDCQAAVKMSGGKVEIKSTGETYASRCSMELSGGEIISESTTYDSHGVSPSITATGGSIYSKGARRAYGFEGSWAGRNLFDGGVSITAESTTTSGDNLAARAVSGTAYYTFNDANITAITPSGQSRALDAGGWGATVITGGTFTASSASGSSYAVVINSNMGYDNGNIITGGTFNGGTYGIYTESGAYARIGSNDENISITTPDITGGAYGIGGAGFDFYDGILKGGTAAFESESIIKAIPDGSIKHLERLRSETDPVDTPEAGRTGLYACWLEEAENYLSVNDEPLNSLTKAYAKVADGGTIKVIKDAEITTALPASPSDKAVIFDLNGYTLSYTQPMTIGGTMTIKDSSASGTGVLTNPESNKAVISNQGTLNIQSGTIYSPRYRAIENSASGTVINLTGGTVKISGSASYAIIDTNNRTPYNTTNIDGGSIVMEDITGSAIGLHSSKATLTSGSIIGTGTGTITGIQNCADTFTINGGTIDIRSDGETFGSRCPTSMSGGSISSISKNSTAHGVWHSLAATGGSIYSKGGYRAYGLQGEWITYNTLKNVSITVESTREAADDWSALAINGSAYYTIEDGTTIIVKAKAGNAYGLRGGWGATVMTGGTITATSETGSSYGMRINSGMSYGNGNIITGGTINASTYGIYTDSGAYMRIGDNDGDISITTPDITGGVHSIAGDGFDFFDGILKGGTAAYQSGVIKAIPDGTLYHLERLLGPDDPAGTPEADRTGLYACWLENGVDYLSVNDEPLNSLTKAYQKAGDGGTIKVIRDANIITALPATPANTTVTFDLNGHTLSYSQSMPISGTLNIIDSSTAQTGVLTNPDKAVIANGGTLNILSGTILSSHTAIEGTVSGSTINLNGGEIKMTGGASYAIRDTTNRTPYGTTVIDGGKITMENITGSIVAILLNTVELKSGSISSRNSTGTITGLQNCASTFMMSGGTIDIQSDGETFGSRCPTNMSGGSISSISKNSTAHGVWHSLNATGGSIYSKGGYRAYGLQGEWITYNTLDGGVSITAESTNEAADAFAAQTISGSAFYTIKDATIVAKAVGGTAKALNPGGWGATNVSGGTITATSTHGDSYAAYINSDMHYDNGNNITGGTFTGGTYGIYTASGAYARIGKNGEGLSITTPDITGGAYGIGGAGFDFYDGILKGQIKAYEDGVIYAIADDTTMFIGTTVIDGDNYDTRYLIPESDVAKIGTTMYTSLQKAVNSAQSGDKIELIADNYIFKTVEIPADKDITIETNGWNIIESNPIKNSGKVKLQNTNTAKNPTIEYLSSNYFIQNLAGGELEIVGIPLKAPNAIDNSGKLILDGVTITSTGTAVNNADSLIAKNRTSITGSSYAVYSSGTKVNLTDTTLVASSAAYYQSNSADSTITDSTITGTFSNSAGKLDVIDTTVQYTANSVCSFISNTGTGNTIFNNANITFTHNAPSGDFTCATVAINNTNEMTFENSSTVDDNIVGASGQTNYLIRTTGPKLTVKDSTLAADATGTSANYNNRYAIHNNGSDIKLEKATISINHSNSYGLYNQAGNVTIADDSTIESDGRVAYGIYINAGEITIGEAEPVGSEHYGKDTATVSTTYPAITGTGTESGVGVKNIAGRFNYYDGILTGSTAAMPETPTNVEYLYEPKFYTLPNGNQYAVLEWMREQP